MKLATMELSVKPSYKTVLTDSEIAIFKQLHEDESYNDTIADKLIERHNLVLSDEERSNLKTFVYIARGQIREMKQVEDTNKLIADGWNVLSNETAKELNGQKVKVLAKKTNDWLSTRIEETFKIYVDQNGNSYIMKPRARSRGLAVSNLDRAFYQLIN